LGETNAQDIARVLHIFEHNTPPRLRTDSAQIRAKIASPHTEEGDFYFAALYRALGMLDFEPVVIDHPVSSITQDEIDARVRQIKEQAEKIWIAN
jgi:hypothetical protein